MILYIDNVFNSGVNAGDLDEIFEDDWMTMLPVAYGKISLEKIKANNPLLGCELIKIENNNQTIDHALNEVIMRP